MNYEKLYYFLFNGITDIISLMEKQENNDIQNYVFM